MTPAQNSPTIRLTTPVSLESIGDKTVPVSGEPSGSSDSPIAAINLEFLKLVLDQLQKRFAINQKFRLDLTDQLLTRIAPPKKSDAESIPDLDRLRRENEALMTAFWQTLRAVPKSYLTQSGQLWINGTIPLDQQPTVIREMLQHLETVLNDNQLGQIYSGVINFFDIKHHRGQTLPYHWDGLRSRILAASEEDITPRSHLNYFCNVAAKAIEWMILQGYNPKEVRTLVHHLVDATRARIQAERQTIVTHRVQNSLNDLTDSLRSVHQLVEDIMGNVRATQSAQQNLDDLTHGVTGINTRHVRLAENLKHVEQVGIVLPSGLKDSLKQVVRVSRDLSQTKPEDAIQNPKKLTDMMTKIQDIKKVTQSVACEFRRVRRKTQMLFRKVVHNIGRRVAQAQPKRIHEQKETDLVHAAKELIWSLQDTQFTMETEDIGNHPGLMKVKAALMLKKNYTSAMEEVESCVHKKPLAVMDLRLTGKKLLDAVFNIIQHFAPKEAGQHENETIWVTLADLADSYERFSILLEGEEHVQLRELPTVISELHQEVGSLNQQKVLPVPITSALEKEKKCQAGELRMSVSQRMQNLHVPLRELLKASLEVKSNKASLRETRHRALELVGLTQETSERRSNNYLVELTLVPIARLFVPHDPKYGRSISDLEKRVRFTPVPGILPEALLFGARKANSLDDLGNVESARERLLRAERIVNQSGLIGEVLGIHPLWSTILASDETRMLLSEMTPLFAGGAGEGFLMRVLRNNEEYVELNRINEEESLKEARLLLHYLVHPEEVSLLQQLMVECACFLTESPLSEEVRAHSREFLQEQREFLQKLNIEDPTEFLKSGSFFELEENRQAFAALFSSYPVPLIEMCLLQLFHRRIFNVDLLVSFFKQQGMTGDKLKQTFPLLFQEFRERYQWYVQSGKSPSEQSTSRWLLDELGFTKIAELVDWGMPEFLNIHTRVERLHSMLEEESQQGMLNVFFIWVRRVTGFQQRMGRMIQHEIDLLRAKGFHRDAALLTLRLQEALKIEVKKT